MILAATIKVDPKPIASWRGYARSLKLTIVQIEALQGFVGLGRSAGHPAIAFTLPCTGPQRQGICSPMRTRCVAQMPDLLVQLVQSLCFSRAHVTLHAHQRPPDCRD